MDGRRQGGDPAQEFIRGSGVKRAAYEVPFAAINGRQRVSQRVGAMRVMCAINPYRAAGKVTERPVGKPLKSSRPAGVHGAPCKRIPRQGGKGGRQRDGGKRQIRLLMWSPQRWCRKDERLRPDLEIDTAIGAPP